MGAQPFGRDLVHAWRRLRASPLFTLFAVATLACGIGATTAIYAVVHAVLSPPPGVRDPGSLAYLYHYPCCSGPIHSFAWPDFLDYRDRQTAFEDVAAYGTTRQTLAARDGAETAFMEIVSGSYFDVLGVEAALGRTLQPRDDAPEAPLVVVLSHGTWQRVFGARPDVIGQNVRLAGRVFEVVGVAPRSFRGLFNNGLMATSAWAPLEAAPLFPATGMNQDRGDRERRWLRVVGRLARGSTMEAGAAELTGIAGQLDAAFPIGEDITDARFRTPYSISRPWALRPMTDVPINITAASQVTWLAAVVMIAVCLVLMVACSNLANLMLARGAERRHELAVRLALGASRWRLVRAALAESALLAAAGGVAGVVFARLLIYAMGNELAVGNGALLVLDPRLDISVLAASLGATMLALLVAGVGPALQSTRADVRGALASDAAHGSVPRWLGRRLLITAQVAVSVVLLAVASLFVSQLREEGQLDSGMDVDRIAVAEIGFADQGFDEIRTRQVVASVLGQLANRADVEAAAVSSGLPAGMTTPGGILRGPGEDRALTEFVAATPSIFPTLGVPVLRGRAFDARDTAATEPVIVLNETAARAVFGRADVVGQQVELERRRWVGQEPQPAHTRTIIGVAADTDAGVVGRRSRGVVYLPFDQQYEGLLALSLRAAGDPADLVDDLRAAIRAAGPQIGVTRIGTGDEVIAPPNVFAQISSLVAGVLGGFALLLALAGLYGVLTHIVARRTREIGLRIALGASRRDIVRLVVRQGLSPVVLGVLAGGGLAWLARGLLQPQMARLVPAIDPVSLAGVPLLLLAVGVLACYLPARRAAKVDPNVALRSL